MCCEGISRCDLTFLISLSKADYTLKGRWASSNQLKALRAKTEVSGGRGRSTSDCSIETSL